MRSIYLDCTPAARAIYESDGRDIVPGLEIHMGDPEPAAIPGLLAGATGVVSGHTPIANAVIDGAPELRIVVFLATGASSYVDMAHAARAGVTVLGVAGYGDRTIAEHAVALMLAAVRRIAEQDRAIRAGAWRPVGGLELAGKTLGVIGLGAVGREVARLGAAIGMRVVGWNRRGVPAGLACAARSIDEVLAESDVVSLHVAHTAETERLIDARRLALMRPHAVLVNTARGPVVEEGALLAALRDGRIAHAALDVFDEEPLPPGHPFTRLENVTLTAHGAWNSPEASRRLLLGGLERLRDGLANA